MKLLVVLLFSIFLFIGCGGNGDKSSKNIIQISGVAVDDLILGGMIKVYDASNDSKVLAKSRTDENTGTYLLNVKHDGAIIVEVTCDEKSKILDSSNGEKKPCNQELKLRSAAIITPNTKNVKVNITPLSEFVVRQIKANDIMTKEKFESAQNSIGEMFGFDPIGEDPLQNRQYMKVIESFHEMAKRENSSVLHVIDEIGSDLEDGEMGDDNPELAKKFANIMKKNGISNNLTKNDGIYISNQEKFQNKNSITIAKDFFNELRSQAISVVDYQGKGRAGFLDTEAKILSTTLQKVSLNIDAAGKTVAKVISDILKLIDEESEEATKNINDNRSILYEKKSSLLWSYTVYENGKERYKGTVTLPKEISLKNFTGKIDIKFDGTTPLKSDYFDPQSSRSNFPNVNVEEINVDDNNTEQPNSTLKFSNESNSTDNQTNVHVDLLTQPKKVEKIERATHINKNIQQIQADISLVKKGYGADLHFNDVSLTSADYSLSLKDLVLSAYYIVNGDNIDPKYIIFKGAKLTGRARNYEITGELSLQNYVRNSSIKSDSFKETEYQTHLYVNAFCLGDHREITELEDATAIYKDPNGIEHQLSSHGSSFSAVIDGNIANLNPEDNLDTSPEIAAPIKEDYNNFVGLTFDNISIHNESCPNMVLEELSMRYENGVTYIDGKIFCPKIKNSERVGAAPIRIDFNGTKEANNRVTATFTDANGVSHEMTVYGERISVSFEGNSENLPPNKPVRYSALGFTNIIKDSHVTITSSSCRNPQISYFDIYLDAKERVYNSGYVPTKIVFNGKLSNTSNDSYIWGKVDIDWLNAKTINLVNGDGEIAELNLSINGKLKISNRPEMILNLGYANTNEKNQFTLNYVYGSTSLTGRGDFDISGKNGEIVLSSHNGIKAVIKVQNGKIVYGSQSIVTRNGEVVGELQERRGVPVIKYVDGTFESLP